MSTALLKSARALLSMRYVSFSGALGRAAKSVPSWFNISINCVSGQLYASQAIFAPLFNHMQKDYWYFCHYLHRGTSHGQTSCYEWHLCGLTVNLESLCISISDSRCKDVIKPKQEWNLRRKSVILQRKGHIGEVLCLVSFWYGEVMYRTACN